MRLFRRLREVDYLTRHGRSHHRGGRKIEVHDNKSSLPMWLAIPIWSTPICVAMQVGCDPGFRKLKFTIMQKDNPE